MKVLIITNLFPNAKEPTRGQYNLQQFKELAKLCEIRVVAPVPHFGYSLKDVSEKEIISGMETYHPRYFVTPKVLRSLYGFFFFLGTLGCAKEIKKSFDFDVIFATWAYPDGFGSFLIAKLLKKPIVIKVHGSDINIYTRYFFRRKMISYTLRNSDKVIAVSHDLKQKLINIGVPADKIEVIQNGVDTKLFRPMDKIECRKRLGLPLEKKIVLYVGNLERVKGVDILMEATAHLPQDILLVLVGRGRLLRLGFVGARNDGGINFVGVRPHAEIPLWMNAADVLCLPSRNEGCPNVLLEALACKVPIVASNVGGIPEILNSKEDILVEPGNSKALAKAITQSFIKKSYDIKINPVKSWHENADLVFNILRECHKNEKINVIKIFDQTNPYVSGYSMRSQYITDAISNLGINISVFSSPIFRYKAREERIRGVDYFRCGVDNWEAVKRIPVLKEFLVVRSLKERLAERWNPSIKAVHAHSSVLNALAGIQIAKKHKVPFIYEVRAFWEDAAVDQGKTKEGGIRYDITRRTETSILKKADRITVICEGIKNDIVKRGIQEEKITVIPNGVDTEVFKPMPKDSEIVNKYSLQNQHVIGFIGTFFQFEGLELLIQAAKIVLDNRPDVKFLLVGGGLQEEKLTTMAKELDLSGNVIFTGRVKHDEVPKYYSVMDTLVYPRISKRITELVTPLKPLEAMAFEKMVIASDVGGLKELIKDGFNGILFKSGDYYDLAKKCLYMLDNPEIMKNISKQAREYVVRERNWLGICNRYIQIYRELGIKQ